MIAGLKYGVGYIGVGDFKSKLGGKNTKTYNTWSDMLKRCYSAKCQERHPTYIGCRVTDEWHDFQEFAKWYEVQANGDGWQLDKDLIFEGNKTYSPEFCSIIPREINTLLTDRRNERGELPRGVALKNRKYQVRVNKKGARKYLGVYPTAEEAFDVYKSAKEEILRSVAEEFKDLIHPKVYQFLIKYEVSMT